MEIVLVRHAQASFGAADYDVLSDLGHDQSRALGQALKAQGLKADAIFTGAQRRHRETLEGIATAFDRLPAAQIHAGLNEYDFKSLLAARYPDGRPERGGDIDRCAYFQMLRDTVLMWQRDELESPPERWSDFTTRVAAALDEMVASGAERLLVVSSGGAISQLLASSLETPSAQMIRLQLQMKNCAVSRLSGSPGNLYVSGYNETPHIDAANASKLLTYS